jgi:hypothetical protein
MLGADGSRSRRSHSTKLIMPNGPHDAPLMPIIGERA